jgi:hypothetical protein
MATDYTKLKVTELKAELKRLGLPHNGLKADLVARLEEAAAANGEGDSAAGELEADAATTEDVDDTAQEQEDTVDEGDAPETDLEPEQAQPELDPESESAPAESAAADTADDTLAPETDGAPEAGAASSEITEAAYGESPPPIATADFAVPSAQPSLSVPSSSGATPLRPAEVQQDSQKRKRRSASPPPNAHDVALKRARLDKTATETATKPLEPHSAQETPQQGEEADHPQSMDLDDDLPREPLTTAPSLPDSPEPAISDSKSASQDDMARNSEDQPDMPMQDDKQQTQTDGDTLMGGIFDDSYPEGDSERDVEPSIHPATSALYIKNFMRPLRPQAVKDHLLDLATPPGVAISDDTVEDFYLDLIRTHSFVVFNSVSAASRVRTALHNRVWPDETNRKALWVDFMPPERFNDWVDLEQPSGGGRASFNRWEVVYEHDDDGNVVANLEESGAAPPAAKVPPPERKASIPTGPTRGLVGVEGAPTGPRGFQAGVRPQAQASRPDRVAGESRSTRAYPSITYQPVPDDLADKRLSTLRSTKNSTYDQRRDTNKEYQRYFFEHGSTLVNRGPEIFLGIRPPHRERERRREQNQDRDRDRDRGRDRDNNNNNNRRRGRRGGGGHRRMPMPHGVPKGGDRYRGAAASSADHEDRPRGGDRYRGGSYDRH